MYEVGAVADQPLSPADGGVADSFTRYPVTAVLSVAVKAEIGTVRDELVLGRVKEVRVGAVVSEEALMFK